MTILIKLNFEYSFISRFIFSLLIFL